MNNDGFNWLGLILRFLAALFVVYATYNPEGYSYYHWVASSLKTPVAQGIWNSDALKFMAGVLLLTAWIVFFNATRNSLGLLGVTLTLAICGGFIWFLSEMDVFTPESVPAFTHLVLLVIAVVLALGMSWAHMKRRLTGQVATDEVD